MKKYKLYKSGKSLVIGIISVGVIGSTLISSSNFGLNINSIVKADSNLPLESSTVSWPNTNGKTLVGSDYSKVETRNFSEVNEFPREYSATPVLDSQKNLALFINGNQVDINSLPTDGTGGKPKLIKTSEMGSNTYFYANNIMSVLQNGKYVDVDLKLVVTGTDLGNDSTSVGFGVKGKNESGNQFLSTGSGSQVAQRGNFTKFHYQFFVHGTNTPIAVKFHMGFTDLDFEEAIKIQENVVNKVYVDQKSKIPYTIDNGMLAITRDFNDNTNKNDTNASGNTHVVLYDIDAPINGFDLDISTSGHDSKNSSAISQGSKVAPSVLSTMKYEGTLETNYLDKNGNKLTDTEYNSDIVGTSYTTSSKEIPGYKLIEQPNNANGTYIDGRITVNYVYVKQGDLVVNYVDKDGNKLTTSDNETGDVDSSYTTKPKEIPGYKLVETPSNANGTYTDGTTTVNYVYVKQGDLVVNYVDKDGNKLTTSDNETGDVDSSYITKPKEIPGYKLVETPSNANGTYTDGTTTVNYVYVKQGDLVVNYVDKDGNKLTTSDNETGDVDSSYTTKPKEISGYKLVETPSNANGTYTDGTTTVNYVYEKEQVTPPATKQGDLVVNYVDKDGNKLTTSDNETGDVDSSYTTKPKEIPGYKLVETPSNASGTYTDGTTTVNYVYEKEQVTPPATKQGDLVVNYVDKDGNKLATSDNETGDVDSSYTTKPKEISGYKLVETPSNANGTYTDGTTTVNYVYVKQGDLVVNYVDKDGNKLTTSDNETGDVDSSYITKPKEIPGYKLVETPSNANGTYTDGTTTVNYVYVKQGDLVVNYVDKDGNKLTTSDNETGDVDSSYTTKPKEIPGYKLVETPSNASGTYTDGTTTVNYVYEKEQVTPPATKQGDLVVNYVDKDGNKLTTSDNETGDVDSSYTTKPKEIPGYKLVETPSNANGTYTDGTTTVNYVYEKEQVTPPATKQGDLVVNYVDKDGNKLATSDNETGDVDSSYTTKPKEISGYKLVETPSNANGTYTDGTTTVNYVYVKQGDLVVNYVDKDGNKLTTSDNETGDVDSSYITKPKEIPGYKLVETPSNANGTYTDGTTTVNYVYVKQGDLVVNYVDKDGNKLTTSDNETGDVDSSYTTKPKEISGYKLVETPSNASGTYTDGTTTVNYVYEKEQVTPPATKQGDLVVNYVDKDGNKLTTSDNETGDVDSSYTTKPKEIPGYKLVETPSNANGTYTDGTTTVNYVYEKEQVTPPATKQGDLVVNYVDKDGNKLTTSDNETGDVDSSYTTKPKEIPGYKLVETPSNANGTYTDGTTTVNYVYEKEQVTPPATKQGDLVVNYVDKDGNKLTTSDNETGDVDSSYTTKPKEIPGYKLVETPSNANGTYTDGTTTVNYVYVKQGDLVVNYVDKDGNKLTTSDNETGDVDSSYITKPKEIPGYKLVETPSNANGTYTDGTTTVNYVYEKEQVTPPATKQGDLVVNYVDKDGNKLTTSDNETGDVDSSYTTKPKEIPGYKLVETPSNASGTYTDGTTTVNYVYEKEQVTPPATKQGDLVVNYVDKDGNKLATSDNETGDVDSSYTTKPKEISGYKLVETPSNANGTYTDGTTTVNYVYEKEQVTPPATKQGDLVVNYVDKDGNKLTTSDNETGDIDSSYTTKPKEIPGYKLVETPSNANGTYTDGTTTVNYVYEKEQVSGKTTYGQNKADKTNREKNLSNENSELPKTSDSDNVSKQYFIVGLLVTMFGFVSLKLRNKNR